MRKPTFLRMPRLLPIVMAVGVPLLALEGAGLVHDAQAEEAAAASTTASQDAELPDPANDPAGVDAPSATAAEVGVLTSLAKRRSELDSQAQKIAMRENLLAATEQRVDAKIAMLKQLQAQIEQLLAQRDANQEKQIASLVKTYSSMKPKDAARILSSLDDAVLVPVAQEMKPDVLGPILANMQAEQAQKLTIKLANRLQVPDPQLPAPPPAPSASAAAPADPSALAAALSPETPTAGAAPGPTAPATAGQAPPVSAAPPQAATQPAPAKPQSAQATPPSPQAATQPAPAKPQSAQAAAPQAAPGATGAHGG